MSGSRTPTLGFAVYRALDGVSDLACIITQVEHEGSASGGGQSVDFWACTITVFPPMKPPMYYNRIKFEPQAGPQSAKPGTVYRW